MKAADRYGNFTDSPADKRWFLQFNVLMLKNSDHRKILNRQPEMRICHGCKLECVRLIFDLKAMSN